MQLSELDHVYRICRGRSLYQNNLLYTRLCLIQYKSSMKRTGTRIPIQSLVFSPYRSVQYTKYVVDQTRQYSLKYIDSVETILNLKTRNSLLKENFFFLKYLFCLTLIGVLILNLFNFNRNLQFICCNLYFGLNIFPMTLQIENIKEKTENILPSIRSSSSATTNSVCLKYRADF